MGRGEVLGLPGICAQKRGPCEVATQHFVILFWILLARFKFNTVLAAEGEARETGLFTSTCEESLQYGVSKNRGEEHAVVPPRPE